MMRAARAADDSAFEFEYERMTRLLEWSDAAV